jgi:hypothetical protein
MMNRMSVAALFCILVSTVVSAQEPAREELLENSRVVEAAVEPEFIDLTAEQLKEQLEVVSSRSYAVFGFNNPEVQIHLPRFDNSIYASVEFSSPRLLDAAGNEVRYELERGIYDHDTHSDEIRFAPVDGGQTVAFARAEGSITLRYPIRMRIVAIKQGGSAPAGLTVNIDGPFVSWSDPEEILPQAAPFTPVEQFRAVDASGRRLEQNSWKGFSMSGGVSFDTYAFWGEVAEVRIDVVEEWAELEISYSLPSIDPLPAARVGTAPEGSTEVEPTPGGTVDIRVVGPDRHQGEETVANISKDQALAELQELGFRRFDENSYILAATLGKADALRLFIAAGMPVDSQSGGTTALMSAAMMGRVEAGKVLIDAGADVNQTDSTGSPPLTRLVMQCDATELVRAFIDAGADLSVELAGHTTLHQMAELGGCTENAKVLKAAGAK